MIICNFLKELKCHPIEWRNSFGPFIFIDNVEFYLPDVQKIISKKLREDILFYFLKKCNISFDEWEEYNKKAKLPLKKKYTVLLNSKLTLDGYRLLLCTGLDFPFKNKHNSRLVEFWKCFGNRVFEKEPNCFEITEGKYYVCNNGKEFLVKDLDEYPPNINMKVSVYMRKNQAY